MFLVIMAEERRAIPRLISHPLEAHGVEQLCFRKCAEGVYELLKDGARLRKHVGERAVPVGRVHPGVDLVVRRQLWRPGWWRRWLMAQRCLEAPHRPAAPSGQVGDDVLDRPLSGDARLCHVCFADVAQQRLPLGLFVLQVIEELRFARGETHKAYALQIVLSAAFRFPPACYKLAAYSHAKSYSSAPCRRNLRPLL